MKTIYHVINNVQGAQRVRVSTEQRSTGYAHKNVHLTENKQNLTNWDANALNRQNLQSSESSGQLGGPAPAVVTVLWRGGTAEGRPPIGSSFPGELGRHMAPHFPSLGKCASVPASLIQI